MKKALLLAMVMLLSGCASIMAGGQRTINIKSIPSDASLIIRDSKTNEVVHKGQTPIVIPLSTRGGYFRSREYEATVLKEGYVPKVVKITSFMSGWYAGNLMLWPVAVIGGLIIDPLTGAMWSLTPKDVNAILEPEGAKIGIKPQEEQKTKEEQIPKIEKDIKDVDTKGETWVMVWPDGRFYHIPPCPAVKLFNGQNIKLKDAEKNGYKPCPQCIKQNLRSP